MIEELHQEGVRPVSPDQEAIEAISRAISERAEAVLSTQQEILEGQDKQDLLDEQEFYAQVRWKEGEDGRDIIGMEVG